MATQSPAATAFFDTPELVLLTLTFLSTTSLITAMRVCRDFHEKIRDGREYKKMLFLEPAEPVATYRAPEDEIYDGDDPLELIDIAPTEPPYITNTASGWGRWHDLGTPNPLFARAEHYIKDLPEINLRFRTSAQKLLDHYDRMAQSSQGEIWSQMFICQPPTKEAIIRFRLVFETSGDPDGEPKVVECYVSIGRAMVSGQQGVRIIDLVKGMRSAVAETERERKEKSIFENYWVEVSCRRVVDEFCPFVLETLDANMVIGIKPGDELVPVWTDQHRTIRENCPRGSFELG